MAIVHPNKKLGQAKKDGIYYVSWRDIYPKINHKLSHLFMNSDKVSYRTRKWVLQYRWGVLPTNRWLYKCKLTPSLLCPLCSQEDGGHHALSGCPALSAAITKRHNDAGTEIVRDPKQQIGAHVLLSDVGIRRRRLDKELTDTLQFCRYLADAEYPWSIPTSLQDQLRQYRGSVPDALLYSYNPCGSPRGNRYTIVDIKYCRDTSPEQQEQRALRQHEQLKDLIEEFDPKAHVRTVTLMLGVSGAIYHHFLENMQKLGVTGPALNNLAKKLHFVAIHHVKCIWKQRAAMVITLNKFRKANWSKQNR